MENRFDDENQVPHSEQCLWAMQVETLRREQEVQDQDGGGQSGQPRGDARAGMHWNLPWAGR